MRPALRIVDPARGLSAPQQGGRRRFVSHNPFLASSTPATPLLTQQAFQSSSGGGSDAFMVRYNTSTCGTSINASTPVIVGFTNDTGSSSTHGNRT